MIKKLLSSILFIALVHMAFAQQKLELSPCGTTAGKSTWLKKYQKNPGKYALKSDTILYVPISLHLVGTDNGQNYYSLDKLISAFCQLNADYEAAKIQFFLEGDIQYIPNSAFYSHTTVLQGAEFMLANNIAHTLNCYVVGDPAGNCGYNLPYAGVCLSKGCIGDGDHTWAHEVGHALSLPHPFLGWEGKTYDYNTPTPTTVTYDYTYFHDTPVWNPDTMIIDTAFVELTDGSNCYTASDGFCDTPPDYLSYRWQCNGQSNSLQKQKDPNGVDFYSDGTLFMSYSYDICSGRFSDEQIAAMRANLLDEKPDYLYNQTPLPTVSTLPTTLLSPVQGELTQFDDVQLDWEPVENATHYIVQVSIAQNFNYLVQEYISDTTTLTISNLQNNKTYYWRVRAFNRSSFCSPISGKESFQTAMVSSVSSVDGMEKFKVYPTLLSAGESVNLSFTMDRSIPLSANLFDATGRLMQTHTFNSIRGNNTYRLETNKLLRGVYLIGIESENGIIYRKIAIE